MLDHRRRHHQRDLMRYLSCRGSRRKLGCRRSRPSRLGRQTHFRLLVAADWMTLHCWSRQSIDVMSGEWLSASSQRRRRCGRLLQHRRQCRSAWCVHGPCACRGYSTGRLPDRPWRTGGCCFVASTGFGRLGSVIEMELEAQLLEGRTAFAEVLRRALPRAEGRVRRSGQRA